LPRLGSIIEGGTRLIVPSTGNVKGPGIRASIFYNPAMRSNRDITVLFGKAVAQDGWSVLDALGGTGAKGMRLAVESGLELDMQINDRSSEAFDTIKKNIRANKMKIKATNLEYNALLSNSGFDWIDIDPFGSPVKFLDLAVRRASRNGVISITATDTAPLCGSKRDTCERRYLATPMKSGCAHEFGLRILVGNAVRRAAVYDYGLEPLLAYYHGHYFRAYFRKLKGAGAANSCLEGIGHVAWDDDNGYTVAEERPPGTFAGPLWTGDLWKPDIVKKMLKHCDDSFGKETRKLLEAINGELLQPPYHHHIDHIASITGTNPLKTDWLVERLRECGHTASGVHYNRKGFKTDAGLGEVGEIFNTQSH
jgi:tRNA (guanine26-N2/guanine27-N2)-dimethyltransferase